jgi:hypothetical protein
MNENDVKLLKELESILSSDDALFIRERVASSLLPATEIPISRDLSWPSRRNEFTPASLRFYLIKFKGTTLVDTRSHKFTDLMGPWKCDGEISVDNLTAAIRIAKRIVDLSTSLNAKERSLQDIAMERIRQDVILQFLADGMDISDIVSCDQLAIIWEVAHWIRREIDQPFYLKSIKLHISPKDVQLIVANLRRICGNNSLLLRRVIREIFRRKNYA